MDTMVIIEGVSYKTAKEESIWKRRIKKDDSAPKTIYFTGIEGVYCSHSIYGTLQQGMRGCINVPEIVIYDNNQQRIISTGIKSVTFSQCDTTETIIDGSPLGSNNSITFSSIEQFSSWLRTQLK